MHTVAKQGEASTQEAQALSIDTIRALAMDAVQKANAGHPGTAMALAPLAYTIYRRFLRTNPADPHWPDRDRFVLSSGHACILQYSLLHLTGFDLSLDDLQQFRQWGSRTPGHPERGHTAGIEVTTGPLGQGISNAVGMAMAERFLAERYNRPGHEIVDHHVYVICSDGDLMEGVSAEAASIAGQFGLGKLIVCYDDNRITIDGSTAISFDGEDHLARFASYGWHVQHVADSESVDSLRHALLRAREEVDRPSFIAVRSHIAYPAPHAVDTAKSHGAPLGEDEVRATKEVMGFDPDQHFWVDPSVYEHMNLREEGDQAQREWEERFGVWREANPELADDWDRAWAGRLADGWQDALPSFTAGEQIATRAAGQKVMNSFARYAPTMFGGAADLVESTRTSFLGGGSFRARLTTRTPCCWRRCRRPAQAPAPTPAPRGARQWRLRARRHRQAVRLDLPDLLRLHARKRAPVRPHGPAGRMGLDARLGRPRRGRPDPPARRALRRPARDPEPLAAAPGRRHRDRDGVAGRARA